MENNQLATTNAATTGTGLVASNMAGARRSTIFNALNNAQSLNEAQVDTFHLAGILQRGGSKAVTGEPCTDTYLIVDDGSAYFTQSDGIARAALELLAVYEGNVAGLGVQVTERAIGGGRTIKGLLVVHEPDEA